MNCPNCRSRKTTMRKIVHRREGGETITLRYRGCNDCGRHWSTTETILVRDLSRPSVKR